MILDHEALGLIIKREHPWIWVGEYRPWVPMEHHVGLGCPSVFRECFWRWGRRMWQDLCPEMENGRDQFVYLVTLLKA